jgi:TrpR-related protein YerC/YecD
MAKTNPRLPKSEVEKYFYQLCLAVSKTNNIKESAMLMRDLLTDQESEMLARRLKIAELLMEDKTYEEIRKITKASPITIAKVQEWMRISGEGYRLAIERTKNKLPKERNENVDFMPLNALKKKYPMYYWPEILVEELVKSANKRQRKRFQNVIKEMRNMKRKTALHRKLERMLIKVQKYSSK